MGFIDPASVFVAWGNYTMSAGSTTMTIVHGASFIPTAVILFPKDVYAWSAQAAVSNLTGTSFDITMTAQAGDAAFDFVVGKN